MLWNILYEKQIFNGILNSDLEEVKSLFENTISDTINNHTIDFNNNKINIIDINKLILEKIIINIKNFKNKQLEGKSDKDNFKNEKIKIFDRDLDNKIKSFNASMNINKPNDIDFLDKLDEPLNNDEMLDKLKQIEKERFIFSINNDNNSNNNANNNVNNVNNVNNLNNENNENNENNVNNENDVNNDNNDNFTNKLKINKQMVKIDEENNIENKINKLDEKLKDIYNILNEILSNQQKLMQNNK